jgi:hypothetical protein
VREDNLNADRHIYDYVCLLSSNYQYLFILLWHAWERREKCARFWWESPKEGDHLEDPGLDRMGSEWIFMQLIALTM